MYRYNTKSKISLTNKQSPKQQRTRMKNRSHKGEGTNGRGRIKKRKLKR
jgi:hypothetical protein